MIYQHDVDRALANTEVDFNLDTLRARYKTLTGQDMPVTLRRDLARPLTTREMDTNFQGLDQALMRAEYGDGPYPVFDQVFGAGARFLDPRITFTRPGKSWRIVNGVLREYDVNEPCLTGDWWSVRPAETNLCPAIGENGESVNAATLTSADPSPMGSSYKLTESLGAPASTKTYFREIPVSGAVKSTRGFALKAGERTKAQLVSYDGIRQAACNFDLATGTVGNKDVGVVGVIEPLFNEWWLCNMTATSGSGATFDRIQVNILNDDWQSIYEGDGVSGIYISAPQFNLGDPIPYIPTTDSAVTRPADNASIQGAAFVSVWNPMEGAVVVDVDTYPTAGATWNTSRILQTPVGYWWISPVNTVRFVPAGKSDISINDSARSKKLGASWSGTSISIFYNGSLVAATTFSGSNPAVDTITLAGSLSTQLATNNRRLTIFTRRPSDAQMEAMTS